MVKRALIIRSGYNPLAGFENSASCIAQSLRTRGFEIVSCEGGHATRAGILRAYEDLIGHARPDDAVVVYYVGHGGLVTNPSYTPGGDLPRHFQYICPTDFAQTTEVDFRGISSPELSLRLVALSRKTRNATVILDCCYAAQMSRGDESPGARPVSPALTRAGLVHHLRSLDQRELERVVTGNPDAVRVVATEQSGSAYYVMLPHADALRAIGVDLPAGGWIGAMTLELVQILAEVGDRRVTWRSVGEALRARLHVQRPEIEGPIDRIPFSLEIVEVVGFGVRADMHGGGAIIEAGSLLGVSPGDVYGVMPAGSTRLEPECLVADVTVDEVTGIDSRSHRIAWRTNVAVLPAHAVAIPRALACERYPVHIVADGARESAIAAALCASPRLRVATPHDGDRLAELRVEGDALELRDVTGPLSPPRPYPGSLADAVHDLETMATVRRLRAMSGDQGLPPGSVSVELLVGGTGHPFRALADHDAALGLEDRFAVRLANVTGAPLFGHVFDVGLRQRIVALSDPGGLRLMPDSPVYCGAVSTGRLVGIAPSWPAGLPRDWPRISTVLVVITREPADLSALTRTEHLVRSAQRASSPPRSRGARARGGTRGESGSSPPAAGTFALHWLDFWLG